MLLTPDIERYFNSEEAIISFLNTFEYEDNKEPF